MGLALADGDTIATAIGAVVAVVAIALTCGCYLGLCVYLAIRANDSAASTRSADPPASPTAPERMPFNWLVPAAVGIVMGFTPCAVAALVHASRVAPHYRAGCFDAARDSARRARAWFWWSVAIGLALIVLFALAPWIAAPLMTWS